MLGSSIPVSPATEDVAGLKQTIEDLQNTNKTSDEAHKNEINDIK